MRYNFKSSLKQGAAGEERLHKVFPTWTRTDGRREDFVTPEGKKIELKTEGRTTEETKNLALEWESSPGKPGAIERAVADDIDYIIYLYADDKYFVYTPASLLEYMLRHEEKHRMVRVQNSTYVTLVLLVPRDAVEHLRVEVGQTKPLTSDEKLTMLAGTLRYIAYCQNSKIGARAFRLKAQEVLKECGLAAEPQESE